MDWATMDGAKRHRPADLKRSEIPDGPGVYAWYRGGRRKYVGMGKSLDDRIWTRHLGQSRSLHTSALRRNVAEMLGFGDANDIFSRVVRLTDEQRAQVRAWILGCEVAWIECSSADAAVLAENDM